MTSNAPASTSFLYIECDIPAEQTLLQWRRERDAARAAARRPRRSLRMLWPARWST